jgi:hypothetical protein
MFMRYRGGGIGHTLTRKHDRQLRKNRYHRRDGNDSASDSDSSSNSDDNSSSDQDAVSILDSDAAKSILANSKNAIGAADSEDEEADSELGFYQDHDYEDYDYLQDVEEPQLASTANYDGEGDSDEEDLEYAGMEMP